MTPAPRHPTESAIIEWLIAGMTAPRNSAPMPSITHDCTDAADPREVVVRVLGEVLPRPDLGVEVERQRLGVAVLGEDHPLEDDVLVDGARRHRSKPGLSVFSYMLSADPIAMCMSRYW